MVDKYLASSEEPSASIFRLQAMFLDVVSRLTVRSMERSTRIVVATAMWEGDLYLSNPYKACSPYLSWTWPDPLYILLRVAKSKITDSICCHIPENQIIITLLERLISLNLVLSDREKQICISLNSCSLKWCLKWTLLNFYFSAEWPKTTVLSQQTNNEDKNFLQCEALLWSDEDPWTRCVTSCIFFYKVLFESFKLITHWWENMIWKTL